MPPNQPSFADQLSQRRAALLQLQQQRQQQRRPPRLTEDLTVVEGSTTTDTMHVLPVTDRESPVDQTATVPSSSTSGSMRTTVRDRGATMRQLTPAYAVSVQPPAMVSPRVAQPKAAGRERPAGATAAAGTGRPARGPRADPGAAARRALAATLEASIRELRAMTETLAQSDNV